MEGIMTNQSAHHIQVLIALVIVGVAGLGLPTLAQAHAAWADGCITCHGDFNSGTYVSNSDATSWGTSLMSGHSNFMGTGTCNVCHQPPAGTPRSPVYIGLSAGIAGYSPVSCLGCHGRTADAKGAGACVTGAATTIDPANCGTGAGLRKHHANAGVTQCATCHTADGVVRGESAVPAYYFPDATRPNKPINACNAAAAPGNENKFGLAGLDNDGDGLRDSADPDCTDSDTDGVPDGSDNCKLTANPTQFDANNDGYGNICDADINNSGTVTTADFGLLRSVLGQTAGSSATAAASDMNGSGTVTTADFGLLRARLGTTPGPSGLTCAGTVPCVGP